MDFVDPSHGRPSRQRVASAVHLGAAQPGLVASMDLGELNPGAHGDSGPYGPIRASTVMQLEAGTERCGALFCWSLHDHAAG